MGRGGDASPSSLAPGGRTKRLISAAELKKHNSAGDCWFAIEGRVFDVSAWQDHPGGRVLYSAAGTDATDSFRAFHSAAGYAALARFEIGELEPKAREALAPSGFEAEYRELYARVKSDPNFYEAKCVSSLRRCRRRMRSRRRSCYRGWLAVAGALSSPR